MVFVKIEIFMIEGSFLGQLIFKGSVLSNLFRSLFWMNFFPLWQQVQQ